MSFGQSVRRWAQMRFRLSFAQVARSDKVVLGRLGALTCVLNCVCMVDSKVASARHHSCVAIDSSPSLSCHHSSRSDAPSLLEAYMQMWAALSLIITGGGFLRRERFVTGTSMVARDALGPSVS